MSKKKWYWKEDFEEIFTGEPYATREEAIEEAKDHILADADANGEFVVQVGYTKNAWEPIIPDASDIIEQMSCWAYDNCGEVAESWLSDVSEDHAKELTGKIETVVTEWLKKHGHMPDFFIMEEVEDVKISAPASCGRTDRVARP